MSRDRRTRFAPDPAEVPAVGERVVLRMARGGETPYPIEATITALTPFARGHLRVDWENAGASLKSYHRDRRGYLVLGNRPIEQPVSIIERISS